MTLLLVGLALLPLTGLLCLWLGDEGGRGPRLAAVGTGLALVGSLPALWQVLGGGDPLVWRAAWAVPGGALSLELDALSAFFLAPILLLSALAGWFGLAYLAAHHPAPPAPAAGAVRIGHSQALATSPAALWWWYNLLVLSLALVVLARNAVLFLVAWELMTVSSFFLVTWEDRLPGVQRAGWTYLVASHLGAACLFAAFLLLSRSTGTLEFGRHLYLGLPLGPGLSDLVFLLALLGFGCKAGFLPLHVWLPEAHPAAPSHVSAVMSGVMIKTGIYGLLRFLTLLDHPGAWWGWALVVIGAAGGVAGAVLALGQRDLKRFLAYSSVENLGIVALGLGVGVLGLRAGSQAVAVAGFAGALLHVWNHSLLKGLLFLAVGGLTQACGTREIDRLGGLLGRLPRTGWAMIVGTVGICGLPPLNGFMGEFCIYTAAFLGLADGQISPGALLLALLALTAIGGLAAAGFAGVLGVTLLGEPRTPAAAGAVEGGAGLTLPPVILAILCLGLGFAAPAIVRGLLPVLVLIPGLSPTAGAAALGQLAGWLRLCALVGALAIGLGVGLFWLRRRLLSGREVAMAVTWDCGYLAPTARMQYSFASFAAPLLRVFRGLLRPTLEGPLPSGRFPAATSCSWRTIDPSQDLLFAPLFARVGRLLEWLHLLQEGHTQLYLFYITITLIGLLVWKLPW